MCLFNRKKKSAAVHVPPPDEQIPAVSCEILESELQHLMAGRKTAEMLLIKKEDIKNIGRDCYIHLYSAETSTGKAFKIREYLIVDTQGGCQFAGALGSVPQSAAYGLTYTEFKQEYANFFVTKGHMFNRGCYYEIDDSFIFCIVRLYPQIN